MIRSLAVLASLLTLASCASLKSLPDEQLNSIAQKALGAESKVDPLEMTLATDYTTNRVTLVRTYTTTTDQSGVTRTTANPDSILGIYFGNGLYLDTQGNLGVIVNRYLGVDDAYIGQTVQTGWTNSALGASPTETTTTYTKNQIDIKVKGRLLADRTMTYDEKSASGNGETIYFNAKNTKVQPTFFIPLISREVSWEKTAKGLRATWGLFDNAEYSWVDGTIVDREKSILVQNNGNYLRFAYTKGNKFSFRLYRTPQAILILDETSGDHTLLSIADKTLSWQMAEHNLFGSTGKLQDVSLHIVR